MSRVFLGACHPHHAFQAGRADRRTGWLPEAERRQRSAGGRRSAKQGAGRSILGLTGLRWAPCTHLARKAQPTLPWAAAEGVSAGAADTAGPPFDIARLEQYTEKVKAEALVVSAKVDGEEDQVVVFRGFSSSLMRPTASDPGEPVLPPTARILSIDRIQGPFNPANIVPIEEGISWDVFHDLLKQRGL